MNFLALLNPFLIYSKLKTAVQLALAVFILLLPCVFAASGQETTETKTVIIEGVRDADVFGMGETIIVRGEVKKGVMAFGGDVIVEGRIEGDVATVGGSVFQRPNSFIGGDVIILGGGYNHGKTAPGRDPNSQTVMYAGYETELREAMQNPSSLIAPDFSGVYLGQRILAVLFWFVISLILTSISPQVVSRAIARLNLSSLRVAIIGALAMLTATLCVVLGIGVLPAPFGFAVWLVLTVVLFSAYTFGRVVVQVATGKYLQKLIWGEQIRSESVALLLGAFVWTIILSLPFIWTFAFAGLFIVSLGLVLTARPKFGLRQN